MFESLKPNIPSFAECKHEGEFGKGILLESVMIRVDLARISAARVVKASPISAVAMYKADDQTETEARRGICRIGALLHQKGYVAACDGNISVRLGPDLILCTPTSVCKGMMEPDDLVVVDRMGRHKQGKRRASTELGMHLLFYRLRQDITAVVHAHPPTATGFAAAGLNMEEPLVAGIVLACGKIPLAGYGTPGTPELAKAMRPLMPMHDAILMANHGVATCGPDLLNAYLKMESVEHYAKINCVARQLGSIDPLPVCVVSRIRSARCCSSSAS